jgi:hypothetical protein
MSPSLGKHESDAIRMSGLPAPLLFREDPGMFENPEHAPSMCMPSLEEI